MDSKIKNKSDIEFIGLGVTNDFTDYHPRTTKVVDREYLSKIVDVHEKTGWDALLFHYSSIGVDPGVVAAYAATISKRLKFIIAVRPNTCEPTFFAKRIASMNSLAGEARFGVHVIAGGYDSGQRAEGDDKAKDERYERVAEFVDICRLTWQEVNAFDFQGKYYRLENFRTNFDFPEPTDSLFSTAGTSDAALKMAAKHSRRHAIWGLPLAETKEISDKLHFLSNQIGRKNGPELQMHFRPIMGSSKAEARSRAENILNGIRNNFHGRASGRQALTVGEKYAQSVLQQGEWHDDCFWAGPVSETSGAGNSTALVGTPAQLAESFHHYHALGVTSFGINGFDSLKDSQEFGEKVIPLVRGVR